MTDRELFEMLSRRRRFVFVGEAGSGKTEIALAWAAYLADLGEQKIHFFDLDQTKQMFRSREYLEELRIAGVTAHYYDQLLDMPVVAAGVNECLQDDDIITVVDIGGDAAGARTLGQFSDTLRSTNALLFYVLNPFRPWSDTAKHIDGTMGAIAKYIGTDNFIYISNPNLGADSSIDEVLEGNARLEAELEDLGISPLFMTADTSIADSVRERADIPVFPLKLHITYQ